MENNFLVDSTPQIGLPVETVFDSIQSTIQIVGNISIVLLTLFLIKICLDKNKSNEIDKKAINKKIIFVILIMVVLIVLTTLVSIVTHGSAYYMILS